MELGYFRGIGKVLDSIEMEAPDCSAFIARMRGLARQCQLEAMGTVLRQARDSRAQAGLIVD